MKLHRFFGSFKLKGGQEEIIDREQIHQIRRVFRLKEGDRIQLANGKGREAQAEIRRIGADLVVVRLLGVAENVRESAPRVVLFTALLKKDLTELVVQKAVEVGVARVVPVIATRCVKRDLRLDRLQKIAKEAAEKAGRAVIPEIADPVSFGDVLGLLEGDVIMLDKSGDPWGKSPLVLDSIVSILTGPEGGWTEKELEAVRAQGGHIVSLGTLTLQAETVAIIGSYLAVSDRLPEQVGPVQTGL